MTLVFRTSLGDIRLGRVDFVSARRFRSALVEQYSESEPTPPKKQGEWTIIQDAWLEELKMGARSRKEKYKLDEWEAMIWATVPEVDDFDDPDYVQAKLEWDSVINKQFIDHVLQLSLEASHTQLDPPFGKSDDFPNEVKLFALVTSLWDYKEAVYQFLMDKCEFSFDKVLLCIDDLGIAYKGVPFYVEYKRRMKGESKGERTPEVEQIIQFMLTQGVGIQECTDILTKCYRETELVMISRVFAYGWIKSWQIEDSIKASKTNER